MESSSLLREYGFSTNITFSSPRCKEVLDEEPNSWNRRFSFSDISKHVTHRGSKAIRGGQNQHDEISDKTYAKDDKPSIVETFFKQKTPYVSQTYAAALFLIMLGCFTLSDVGLSTLITIAAFLDLIAFAPLMLNVLFLQNAAGVSLKMLILEVSARSFCLSSTLFFKGYLPADDTGSFIYQSLDVGAIVCVILLLMATYTYQSETQSSHEESFPLQGVMTTAFVFATFVHPSLNNNTLFDIFWTYSINLTVVSMIPQLIMIKKVKDEMDGLSVNFVITITLSRCLKAYFWYEAYPELGPLDGGYNITGGFVIGAFMLQCLCMASFLFYYTKAYYLRRSYYKNGGVMIQSSSDQKKGDFIDLIAQFFI